MNQALIEAARPQNPPSPAAPPSRPAPRTRWTWLLPFCLLLAASGGLRAFRDWTFEAVSKESEKPPFPVDELPKVLGSWHALEGRDETLDPDVLRIAGATDYFVRMYKEEKSGQTISVMVLYGLAQMVHAHTPEVCYPSAGFHPAPGSGSDVPIPIPGKAATARFHREVYQKAKAGQVFAEEAYYSFLNNGRWDYDMASHWKDFRHHPGMFKVQVQGRPSGLGKLDNPAVNEFLGLLVQQIEQRLAAGSAGEAASPAPAPPAAG